MRERSKLSAHEQSIQSREASSLMANPRSGAWKSVSKSEHGGGPHHEQLRGGELRVVVAIRRTKRLCLHTPQSQPPSGTGTDTDTARDSLTKTEDSLTNTTAAKD